MMGNTRSSARTAGVLFLCATAFGLADRALLAPVFGGTDYLGVTAVNGDRVVAGAFCQVLAGLSCVGIAVALYPVVRRHASGLAIGSVAFRVVEGTFYLVGALGALLILGLAQQTAGVDGGAAADVSGQVLLTLRDRAGEIGILAFYLGGSLYYLAFLRARLLPRWLSGWGLVGTGLGFIGGVLVFFGALGFMSPLQVALNLPIGLNEIVLAIWLLAVGFAERPVAEPDVRSAVPALAS